MIRKISKWKIEELVELRDKIDFPEFQREPTIWKLDKKQRLIDSIIRGFDVSSIYLHERSGGFFDCIDGQQRINAIWSFIGVNESDPDNDNEFHLKISNEISKDEEDYSEIDQKRFKNLDRESKEAILNYEINVITFSKVDEEAEELNLQFIRLQLGAPLKGGEKLNAMTGEMRDFIFHKFVKHPFFDKIDIQARRFAQHLVAAQIVINEFNRATTGEFTRSRFEDIQHFIKEKSKLTAEDKKIIAKISDKIKIIEEEWGDELAKIKNRALAISVYFFNSEQIETGKKKDIKFFIPFYKMLMSTVKWQVKKGIELDREYKGLLRFLTFYSQASAESYSIQGRHDFLKEYFAHFKSNEEIIGDIEYKKKHGDPNKERAKIKL